jgi:putative ABC transport system ATP-binding protein
MPNELSGGLCQRVSLARAIIKNPNLLLCDEPTGALDFASSKEVLKLLVKINKKYKTTIVIVSHNEAIKYISDQIIRLRDGVVSENKKNEEIKDVEDIWW